MRTTLNKRLKTIVASVVLFVMTVMSGFACSSPETSGESAGVKKAKVIILAGQSNMEGWTFSRYAEANLGEEEYKSYDKGSANVRIAFYKNSVSGNGNPFGTVRFGLGMESARFGPEIGIASELKKDSSTKYYIIKYAVGGTNLYNDWRAPSTGNTGAMYKGLVDYVSSVLGYLVEQRVDFEITDFCFMQGEADCDTLSYAEAYYSNLSALKKDIRETLGFFASEKGIRFIDGAVSDVGMWQYYATVNIAKKTLAEEDGNSVFIDTIAEGLKTTEEPANSPDKAHYDSLSMIKLGKLFGGAILSE